MIEAWVYLPEGSGPHPAVVMAHGIGGIKAGGLAPFAERFREEGFAAIAFEYRNFGGSGGQPREVLSVPRQRADYSTVIGWAVEQAYIDTHQIIAWGTSFAGMHILELAVSDTRVAAAVAQAPLTDGLAAAMMSPLTNGIRLFGLALLDRLGSLFGRQPIYIPGHGRPGDLSIGATPDGPFGDKLMTPKDGTPWHDRVAVRSLLSFSWRRPMRRAASVRVPFLLVVPEANCERLVSIRTRCTFRRCCTKFNRGIPSTLALTAFTLMTAALAASYIPVRRVLRQNPLASLRNE